MQEGEMEKEKPKYNGKHPGGRPPKITKAWCRETAKVLPDMFRNGESQAEVCSELGIWSGSFSKACQISDEFSQAYKRGKELSEAWWAKLGREGSEGKMQIQPATWIFNMKNRFKWTDKVDLSVSGECRIYIDKEDEGL